MNLTGYAHVYCRAHYEEPYGKPTLNVVMFDDLETILCLHLVSPALPEAWTTIQKYISSGYAPVFDCRGQFCIEMRRPEVESLQETPPARLPARFDFDSTDSAIDFQTWIDDEFTTALKKERQVA